LLSQVAMPPPEHQRQCFGCRQWCCHDPPRREARGPTCTVSDTTAHPPLSLAGIPCSKNNASAPSCKDPGGLFANAAGGASDDDYLAMHVHDWDLRQRRIHGTLQSKQADTQEHSQRGKYYRVGALQCHVGNARSRSLMLSRARCDAPREPRLSSDSRIRKP